jgi:hypothetical protein
MALARPYSRYVTPTPESPSYADVGAELFTKPGYEIYWAYVRDFDLPAVRYPRRDNVIRMIDGKLYTEEILQDRAVLAKLGLNRREIGYLVRNPWWDLQSLYLKTYSDANGEYVTAGAARGFEHLDVMTALVELVGAAQPRDAGAGDDHFLRFRRRGS